ncbi:MAG: Sua5/YciO/YrdC/YwlC family protein [Candidatus Paceibacterota bacterium]|jgi:L-threonylcarbamoyladenylate synthase
MLRKEKKVIEILTNGGVVVMPTDTIYGILGNAFNKKTVVRIYSLKKRDRSKPCIILIGSIDEISKFGISLSRKQLLTAKRIWSLSYPTSIIFNYKKGESSNFNYLHKGTNSLAFRLPYTTSFKKFLIKTGPLLAPSANIEGMTPAKNIKEAKRYFKSSVYYYSGKKEMKGKNTKSSKIVKLDKNGRKIIIRK